MTDAARKELEEHLSIRGLFMGTVKIKSDPIDVQLLASWLMSWHERHSPRREVTREEIEKTWRNNFPPPDPDRSLYFIDDLLTLINGKERGKKSPKQANREHMEENIKKWWYAGGREEFLDWVVYGGAKRPEEKPDWYYDVYSEEKGDPEVTCWHCKKTFLCDPMDATCRLCQAPYDKTRCKEFGFVQKEDPDAN